MFKRWVCKLENGRVTTIHLAQNLFFDVSNLIWCLTFILNVELARQWKYIRVKSGRVTTVHLVENLICSTFLLQLTCAANMDMDGEVMAAKGGPPYQSSSKKGQKREAHHHHHLARHFSAEYWTRQCEQACKAITGVGGIAWFAISSL